MSFKDNDGCCKDGHRDHNNDDHCCHGGKKEAECCVGGSECCPAEQKAEMMQSQFFEAMHQVHVCALRKKIEEKIGDKIERAADVVVESMIGRYKARLTDVKCKCEMKEALKAIMMEIL